MCGVSESDTNVAVAVSITSKFADRPSLMASQVTGRIRFALDPTDIRRSVLENSALRNFSVNLVRPEAIRVAATSSAVCSWKRIGRIKNARGRGNEEAVPWHFR